MERFINGKISIKCNTEKELTEFLELCEKAGLRWRSEDLPTDYIPENIPVIIDFNSCGVKRLGYIPDDEVQFALNNYLKTKIMDFKDFMNKESKEYYYLVSFIRKEENCFSFNIGRVLIVRTKEIEALKEIEEIEKEFLEYCPLHNNSRLFCEGCNLKEQCSDKVKEIYKKERKFNYD